MDKTTISYAIPVCNEVKELDLLLKLLEDNKDKEDEIVILIDDTNVVPTELLIVIDEYSKNENNNIFVHYSKLNHDFAKHKNLLNNMCTKNYIFQIDADEIINGYLIKSLKEIIKTNSDVELFWVPRINVVNGITKEHIKKWGWRINDHGWINFPDWQGRLYLNEKRIRWDGKVHEKIIGHKKYTFLPETEDFCIYHIKSIEKQEMQNKFYETI